MGEADDKKLSANPDQTSASSCLRILMIGHEWFSDRPGGGGRYLQELARGLSNRGHVITVLVPDASKVTPPTEIWQGVRVVRLPLGHSALSWVLGTLLRLPGIVKRWGPFDVLHSHFAPIGLVPLWHPILRRARRVCQFQGPWAGESRFEGASPWRVTLQHALERITYARCNRFIALSSAFAELLHTEYRVASHRISVIPSGIDSERFSPAVDRSALRRKLGVGDAPLVFTARRLVQRMGLEVLLQAWPLVLERHPRAQLWVAGEGPLHDALCAQRDAQGLRSSVTMLGRIDDQQLIECHQAADAFVLPTVALEGFGLVTIEALACGTPVIGTRAGATPEVLEPLDPTLLVPVQQPESLAQALVDLLARPDLPKLREASRQHVLRHYTGQRSIEQVEAVLAGH